MQEVPQRIVCAAVRLSSGEIICGVRHWDKLMRPQIRASGCLQVEQGFVDNRFEFLSRKEARKVAEAAGQIIREGGGDELFSENLY